MRLGLNGGHEHLAARTGYVLGAYGQTLEAVDAAGEIRGVVGFDRWTPGAVSMHVALDTPTVGRLLLRAAFAEAFANGRVLARGEVRASNTRGLALARHLGFRAVYRVADGWARGEDMVLFEMRRDECRWLKEKPHG